MRYQIWNLWPISTLSCHKTADFLVRNRYTILSCTSSSRNLVLGSFHRRPLKIFRTRAVRENARGGARLGHEPRVLDQITTFLESRVAEESVFRSVILLPAKRVFCMEHAYCRSRQRGSRFIVRAGLVSAARVARAQATCTV